MNNRFQLKSATDQIHRELDERLSRLDLSDPSDYARFLDFHARTVPAAERALERGGLGGLIDGWSKFRRTSAIEADIAALGHEMPPEADHPELRSTAEVLGAAYVVEGSRLGGRVLRREVASGLPANFLSGDGSLGPWLPLLAGIEQLLYSDVLLGEAKDAARRCFAWFTQVAHEAGIE